MPACPLVTIITPYYNGAAWLDQLLETVSKQTLTDYEHLIIDDHSKSDQWETLVDRCQHLPNVRLLRTATNSGPAIARNVGIAQAKGRFLAFLDADDLWLPKKLEHHTRWSLENGYAFSYHSYRHISHDGLRVGALVVGPKILDFKTLHTRRGVGCLTVLIDRHQLGDFRFPEIDRHLPEDFLAWAKLLSGGIVGHLLNEDLALYRLSPRSRSSNKFKAALAVWDVYRNVEMLPLLTSASWWLQYVAQAVGIHSRGSPRG